MASWTELQEEEPDLAAAVKGRFDAHRHQILATLRPDGSPRVSGIEVTFILGELWMGSMDGSAKSADLRRDPRLALHATSEPEMTDGDAKLAGVAHEVSDEAIKAAVRGDISDRSDEEIPEPYDLFRVEVTELVMITIGVPPDHLVIDSWHQGRGRHQVKRY
jgi:hypothetical protein